MIKLKKIKFHFKKIKIGIIFQDFKLLSDRSVYKNLEFVLKATDWKDKLKINDRIDEVLKEVGMIDLKNRCHFNYLVVNNKEYQLLGYIKQTKFDFSR